MPAEGEIIMTATQSVMELPPEEQVRMTVEKAGEIYKGYFIFFTNSETIRDIGKAEHYAVPRVIALESKDFYESGLSEKFNNRDIYGTPFTCWIFMAEDKIPPILAF